jgi:hypothetical protein
VCGEGGLCLRQGEVSMEPVVDREEHGSPLCRLG